MAHRHAKPGSPGYEHRPICRLPKPECDRLWTAYLHGHEGRPCETMSFPNYVRPVCFVTMNAEEIEAKLSAVVKKGKGPDAMSGPDGGEEVEDQPALP